LIARTILVVIITMAFSQGVVVAVEGMVPLFTGEVYADGRPINRVVEVRLEAANSSLVASAYTFGSARFTFRNISLVMEENYYLAIRDLDFKELRYELRMNDFIPDSASPRVFHFAGMIVLELQSLPKEKQAGGERKAGPKAIDARQLRAEIPGDARREYNLALENIAAGNSKAAIAHLEKAVELAPDYYDALNKLGGEYVRSGRHKEAEVILDRTRTLNPNDPLPLTNLGILYLKQGERLEFVAAVKAGAESDRPLIFYDKAVEVFEKALRLSPLSPRANLYLGTALYKAGVDERAEPLLLNALDLDGQMHEARLTLINVYARHQRCDDARKQISAYLDANPGSPERKRLEALMAKMQCAANP
jgi:Flp pilus assembly protein TadD